MIQATGLSVGEMTALIGLLLTILAQSVAAWRWLGAEFRKRDVALSDSIHERNSKIDALRHEANARHESMRGEFARQDRDILSLRSDMRERLAAIPTGQQIEHMLDRRFGRLESKVESLTHELAARGIRGTHPAFRDDDGN